MSEVEKTINIPVHPVQTHSYQRGQAYCPQSVTLRAYEVYSHLFGKQDALITGGCRGGFGVGELVGYLYARSFPKEQWQARFDEALRGMENLT